jgi:hypothetical protein
MKNLSIIKNPFYATIFNNISPISVNITMKIK